jgi:hypothetical protein
MSTTYFVNLCYGLKIIDDKLINKISQDELYLDNDLIINDTNEDEECFVICIKKSSICTESCSLIKPEKLLVQKEWTERLKSWAKENNCSKFKIGWWLYLDRY